MLDIGIIGAGSAADYHLDAYSQLDSINLNVIADINESAAEKLAESYDIEHITGSHQNLSDFDIDALSICTPTLTHQNIVEHVSELNIEAILLEKPMADSSEACKAIIESCDSNNVNLCLSHNRLFHPSLQNNDVHDKDINIIKATFTSSGPSASWKHRSNQEALLYEEGTHISYIFQDILPNVNSIKSFGRKNSNGVYDVIIVHLRSNNGTIGVIEMSWEESVEYKTEKLDIYYNEGYHSFDLSYSSQKKQFDIYANSVKKLPYELINRFSRIGPLRFLDTSTSNSKSIRSGHYQLINNFVKSISEEKSMPVEPIAGLKSILLLEHVLESLEESDGINYDSSDLSL